MRSIGVLNNGWTFVKDATDAAAAALAAQRGAGTAVQLPHTWNAEDGADGGNDYYRGTCWYVRKLALPVLAAGEEAWLEFGGVAMSARVYVDGVPVAEHEGGFSTFRVDATSAIGQARAAGADAVTIVVSVDNSSNDRVYPQYADFTFYGGIYRDVKLIIVPATHIALGYHGAPGVRVTPEVTLGGGEAPATAVVTVDAWVEGPATEATLSIAGEADDEQRTWKTTVPVEAGHAQAVFHISAARLWDGVVDPYLYTATVSLPEGDQASVRFGCRSYEIDPGRGFILNGRPYPLRGVSRHQDRAGAGNALTPEMMAEDVALIREMGANTIRLAHYQHAQAFYDLCDEAGICVWAEIPLITMRLPNGDDNARSQMRELVLQNYNHPSIVVWGLSNEITAASTVNDELLQLHRDLNDLCHELDATRPTTMANVFMLDTASPILEIPDVNSYNLYFGWYVGEMSEADEFFDTYHATYPDRAIGFSEYGADANPAFHSDAPQAGDYTEEFQCLYHEHMLKMIDERPWLWATHVWNMFDFAADGREEGGKDGQNQKGLVTFDRAIKKDAFYLYKAAWSDEPFVHVCGSRYTDRPSETTEVKVYTNQPAVELFVDGERLDGKAGGHVLAFEVPLGAVGSEHVVEARAGELCDRITLRRVAEPNPTYSLGAAAPVDNWFDEIVIDPSCYSIKDTLDEIRRSPEAGAVLDRIMAEGAASRGDVATSVKDNPDLQRMLGKMTLESLFKRGGGSTDQLKGINEVLQRFKKVEA